MAMILKGYRSYLLPIIKAPTVGATDTNSLFDLQGTIFCSNLVCVLFNHHQVSMEYIVWSFKDPFECDQKDKSKFIILKCLQN